MSMDLEAEYSRPQLQSIVDAVQSEALNRRGDVIALLALLRILENLHREIHDSYFQPSLPTNRQALYNLLKDIETNGGWPYIPRLKLRSLLVNLLEEDNGCPPVDLTSLDPMTNKPESDLQN
jgi:hypothetical protein